jgi:HJR/Mrr/RecB family endonuclease
MSKKLTELIALAEMQRRQQGTGIKNRSAFLALRDDIKEAMLDGWALKQIYRTLHTQQKITCSYQTFVNYANELILKSKQGLKISSSPSLVNQVTQETPEQKANLNDTETRIKKPPELPGFIFNPIAKKEDLI